MVNCELLESSSSWYIAIIVRHRLFHFINTVFFKAPIFVFMLLLIIFHCAFPFTKMQQNAFYPCREYYFGNNIRSAWKYHLKKIKKTLWLIKEVYEVAEGSLPKEKTTAFRHWKLGKADLDIILTRIFER